MGEEDVAVPTTGISVPNETTQLEAGPHTVAAKADHATEIARICQTWALIETDLMNLYGLLMGVDLPPTTGPEPLPRIHHLAFQVFDALPALMNRTELLQRLAAWNSSDDEKNRIEKWVGRVRSAAKTRNRVVHGLWATCAEHPNDLLLVTPTEGMWRYRATDLTEITALLIEVHVIGGDIFRDIDRRLNAFHQSQRAAKAPQQPPAPQSPTPRKTGRK